MSAESETLALEQAKNQVALAVRRLALLHLSFAETLVEEFGDARGKELVVKAIRRYGQKIAEGVRKAALEQGLPLTPEILNAGGLDWPSFGTHDAVEVVEVVGEQRTRIHGCLLAKVWQEYGGEELGRLYCLIDAAKTMAYDPVLKLIHLQAEPDGDDCCELVFRETTEQEREDFANDRDWSYVDIV